MSQKLVISFLTIIVLSCNFLLPGKPAPVSTPITNSGTDVSPASVQTTVSEKDNMTLVYVPAGEFIRGVDADHALRECEKYRSNCERFWFSDAEPVRSVYLDDFWIDQTEITNQMYALCAEKGVCKEPIKSSSDTHSSYYPNPEFYDYPVVYVDWSMADTYCEWTGRRLPTEAEWEKAARGINGKGYPWGNEIDCTFANYYTIGSACVGDTTKVGSYAKGASIYGALDMVGNVWEWVADLYDENYYSESPAINPLGASNGNIRIARGGSWANSGSEIHSYFRHARELNFADFNFGFRCAMSE